jgi:hypothetical protein
VLETGRDELELEDGRPTKVLDATEDADGDQLDCVISKLELWAVEEGTSEEDELNAAELEDVMVVDDRLDTTELESDAGSEGTSDEDTMDDEMVVLIVVLKDVTTVALEDKIEEENCEELEEAKLDET